ncbi:MAG: hypothetical protein Q9187_000583 [Circinaria calcarea]
MPPPQAFSSSYAPRLRAYLNSLLTPVIQPSAVQVAPSSRTTKRGTVVINYSEDLLNDDDFDESDGPRRPTGLRSRREDPNQTREGLADRLGKELTAPVEVQVPIRIDLDVPSFTPQPALPLPADAAAFGINPSLPAYKTPDPTPLYRLKDVFLWNLHETSITPDQFALVLVHELDLPSSSGLAIQISNQIRQQLEEYAGVALHPLFHTTSTTTSNGIAVKTIRAGGSRDQSVTPADVPPSTPVPGRVNGSTQTNGNDFSTKTTNPVAVLASPYPHSPSEDHSPDDTYRCIINLNINLLNKLYTDRFEWSLLHPPGMAEHFAKQTCADIGLAGEWIPAMAHAIYEAVLRLKKEACESGGLVGGNGYGGEIDNLALEGQEAGWRFDHEHLADEWEPKVEILSKEEIEKREGDRERQIRRLRRETARFSSTTNMAGGMPTAGGMFDQIENPDTPMGRGERSKKKRRFRSLSPLARGGTPGGAPDTAAGYGGSGGGLNDW